MDGALLEQGWGKLRGSLFGDIHQHLFYPMAVTPNKTLANWLSNVK